MNEAEFYLEDLKSKFSKIDPDKYYLAYSGGRDSHFLFWFIREYLHEKRIPAVYNNTGIDLPEIRRRGINNADVVLRPTINHWEIKEKYGIPLMTKMSDKHVWEYQTYKERGVPDEDLPRYVKWYVLRDINFAPEHKKGLLPYEAATIEVSNALKEGKLHKVSPHCCTFLKKKPAHEYEISSGRKPIIGIMAAESWRRKTMLTGCFNKKGYFYPIRDLTEDLRQKIEREYDIPVPKIYKFLPQTGCAGCPYGQHGKNRFMATDIDLSLCGNAQRKFIMEYFKESYAFKGYEFHQMLFSDSSQL